MVTQLFKFLQKSCVHFDPFLLLARRQKIRPKKEQDARKELCQPGDEYDERRFNTSVDAVSEMIGEESPHYLTEQERREREAYERRVKEAEERKRIAARSICIDGDACALLRTLLQRP